jgi:hypothetical protein
MSRDELIAALDEIEVAGMSEASRYSLAVCLVQELIGKDPEYAAKRYVHRVHDEYWEQWVGVALASWARIDPQRAVAWFDEQLAGGFFAGNEITGRTTLPVEPIRRLVYALLARDTDGAGHVLSSLPEDSRIRFLRWKSSYWPMIEKNDQVAFANLIRQHLPEKDHLIAIAWPVTQLDDSGPGIVEYSTVADYLDRINAHPDERRACVLGVAEKGTFPRKSGSNKNTDPEDLDALRAWVGDEAPELADHALELAIANLAVSRESYAKCAALAIHFHGISGRDEVLVPFLECANAIFNKEQARAIAAKLADETKRATYLEKFK